MQKEFDVGAGEGKFRARVKETLRGTRKEPGTRSEPAAETGSQSSGSAPSPRLHKTANQRRTFDSKWTESCAALLEASCIQLGVDVHAPWKLRWVRTQFHQLPTTTTCVNVGPSFLVLFCFGTWSKDQLAKLGHWYVKHTVGPQSRQHHHGFTDSPPDPPFKS